ncbi:hypothetical protein L9F63_007174, partial [Diploptera punctata]
FHGRSCYDDLDEDFRAVGRGREACSSPTFRQRPRLSRQPLRMPDAVSGETSGNYKPHDHDLQPENLHQDHHINFRVIHHLLANGSVPQHLIIIPLSHLFISIRNHEAVRDRIMYSFPLHPVHRTISSAKLALKLFSSARFRNNTVHYDHHPAKVAEFMQSMNTTQARVSCNNQ